MNTAHIDPDRLTDAAWGARVLTDAESAHVDGCEECRRERQLVSVAGRLGAREVASMASGSVARAVLARLTSPAPKARARAFGRPWRAGLAIAAALALAVWYGSLARPTVTPTAEPAPIELSVLHELDGLDEPELEDVLESIPAAAGAVSYLEPVPFDDLEVSDLERVLRSMEE